MRRIVKYIIGHIVNRLEKKEKKDLTNMPDRLFKYYKYDDKLNRKRLNGEVYLSSPLDFNDPSDCRVLPKNNVNEFAYCEDGWLIGKMLEIGYDMDKSEDLARSLTEGDDDLKEVHHRQLEKVGILCLTSSFEDAQMWGYYADNTGYCIEYDTKTFVKRLLLGFTNVMDYSLTKLLYDKKKYSLGFKERRAWKKAASSVETKVAGNNVDVDDRESFATEHFTNYFLFKKDIKNEYLREVYDKDGGKIGVLNFIRHLFVKRFVGDYVQYKEGLDAVNPMLFFKSDNDGSKLKYFQKTDVWSHENEFRIVVSLGGRKVIGMKPDIIKNVYLGCDVPFEKVVEIAYMLDGINKNCGLFQMKRTDEGGLEARKIDRSALDGAIAELKKNIGDIGKHG